jgi:PAS domain S-box-containing protein
MAGGRKQYLIRKRPQRRSLAALLAGLCLVAACIATGVPDVAAREGGPRILLLSSYHPGDLWSDSIIENFTAGIASEVRAGLFVEYLDSRRHRTEDADEILHAHLRRKYRDLVFSLIVCADDPALDFLLRHRRELFPDVPVVFCGINNFKPERLGGQTGITGVSEFPDVAGTIELMARLQPGLKKLVVVASDRNSTHLANLQRFEQARQKFGNTLQFVEHVSITAPQATKALASLNSGSAVLALSNLLDFEGRELSIAESAKILAATASVPVYCLWDFQLGAGTIGGVLVSARKQALAAAEMAAMILAGKEPERLPVRSSPNQVILDWAVIERFGIDPERIPDGAEISGGPQSVWQAYRGVITGSLLVIALQALLILQLLVSRKRRCRADRMLRESEQRLRMALDAARIGDWQLDMADRRSQRSDRLEEIFGIDGAIAEWSFPQLLQCLHPEDRDRVERSYNASRESGVDWSDEFRIIRPDLSERWVWASTHEFRDGQGRPVSIAGMAADITARRHAENALRESENRLRIIFEHAPLGMSFHDAAGRIVDCNQHFAVFLNIRRQELIGRSLPGHLPPEVHRAMETARQGRGLIIESETMPPETGLARNLRLFFNPIPEGAAPFEIVTICEDWTDRAIAEERRRQLERQLMQSQKMEAIGTLAGGIAHDFNNLLGGILGFAELAYDDSPVDSPAAREIDQVIKAAIRARNLVRQILAFSRQAEAKKEMLLPATVTHEVIQLLRPTIPPHIELVEEIDAEAGPVYADPVQLQDIIVRLCANAIDAMEEKGGVLRIGLSQLEIAAGENGNAPGDYVRLSIGDTGCGIAPEVYKRIFDPYFTTKEQGKGAGMGLAVVHGVVKDSGGFLSCTSRVGEGTVFNVFLPVAVAGEGQMAAGAPPAAGGGEHILFVDDEAILADMASEMLGRLGYRVTVRTDSNQALADFEKTPDAYDILITDQSMPGMTGLELARRVLAIRPALPVVLCAGFSTPEIEKRAREAGIAACVLKPLAKNDIAALIGTILAGGRGR